MELAGGSQVGGPPFILRPPHRHDHLGRTGQVVPMTAEDQIAISGTVAGGAILSVHHRGGAASGAGFSLIIDGTEGRPHANRSRADTSKRGVRDLPLAATASRLPAGTKDLLIRLVHSRCSHSILSLNVHNGLTRHIADLGIGSVPPPDVG
ncbi:hypothetical protein GCM10018775_81190 [Streptomyces umbrinus]|nr:hypothetical protein GCM10018775_81190 [Streptomyces umbrinus]